MKRVKRYLLILVCIMLLNGCVKNNTTMKINKDKSMNLEITILTKDTFKNSLSSSFNSTDIEKRGFKVTTNNTGDYSGYKVTKKFDNIDELCKADKDSLEIGTILEDGFDFTKLFTKNTDFFKETYTANFKYSVTELQKKYTNITEEDEDNPSDINEYNELELTYTLVLPSKAKSNDASETTDGGKNLVWRLSPKTDSKINYSFVIYNYKHIAMLGGGILLFIIIVIVLIVLLKRKKESTSSLIYKEYDPSIEGQLNKNEIIKDDSNNTAAFVQGEEQTQKPKPSEQTVNNVSTQTTESPITENGVPVMNKENDGFVIPQVNAANIPSSNTQPQIPTMIKTPEFTPTLDENRNLEIQDTPEIIETPKVMQTPETSETPKMIQTPMFTPTLEEKQNEEIEVKPNTFDYNSKPDFVKQNDSHMFIGSQEPKQVESEKPQGGFSTPKLDIPNATALSDMPEYK